MTTSGRFLLGLVLLAAGLAGASYARPAWLSGDRGLAGGKSDDDGETERRAQLERRGAILMRRLAAKRHIVTQLLAGNVTLFEAAALFGLLNDTPEDCRDRYREMIAGESDNEKLCRQVLLWAKQDARAKAYDPNAEYSVERLEAELEEHLAQNGGRVVLPSAQGEEKPG